MTIPEAVGLILHATAHDLEHPKYLGVIFHLDMGKPVRVPDVARKLARRAGLEPGRDAEIVFTGLRPDEKLYEELVDDPEGRLPSPLFGAHLAWPWAVFLDVLKDQLVELEQTCRENDEAPSRQPLQRFVPGFAHALPTVPAPSSTHSLDGVVNPSVGGQLFPRDLFANPSGGPGLLLHSLDGQRRVNEGHQTRLSEPAGEWTALGRPETDAVERALHLALRTGSRKTRDPSAHQFAEHAVPRPLRRQSLRSNESVDLVVAVLDLGRRFGVLRIPRPQVKIIVRFWRASTHVGRLQSWRRPIAASRSSTRSDRSSRAASGNRADAHPPIRPPGSCRPIQGGTVFGVMLPLSESTSTKTGRAGVDQAKNRRDETARGDDDFVSLSLPVPGPNAETMKGKLEGHSSIGYSDGMTRASEFRGLAFERAILLPGLVVDFARSQDPGDASISSSAKNGQILFVLKDAGSTIRFAGLPTTLQESWTLFIPHSHYRITTDYQRTSWSALLGKSVRHDVCKIVYFARSA